MVRHMTKVPTRADLVKPLTNPLAGRPEPIGDLMRRAHRRLVSYLDHALEEAGWSDVKAAHASVLAVVDFEGSRLATLVERGGRTKQATAELAGHLTTTGYLRLVADPADRRAKLYIPTKRGRELLLSCAAIVDDYEQWLDGVVGADAVTQLRRTLVRIVDGAD
jgi:DNA-binding MarR family transcriptional regulator